jgi:hypothetical protein
MEKDYSFCIREDQWAGNFITIKTDGTVIEEYDSRKDGVYAVVKSWTWADFARLYQNDAEPTFAKAAAFVADLLNPKTK